jgi:hypothetical protein
MKTYKGLLNKTNMPENGIFVFGSNPIGINGNPKTGKGGAALVAQLEFGVKHGERMNNCLSKSGKAYGIVTVDAPKKYISQERIKDNITKFYLFAFSNPDKIFFVAYDGENPDAISLNGKTRKTLAKLFKEAGSIPDNVVFEKNFSELINKHF